MSHVLVNFKFLKFLITTIIVFYFVFVFLFASCKEVDVFISVLIETSSSKVKHNQIDSHVHIELKIVGEHVDQQQVDLSRFNMINIREVYAANTNGNAYFLDFVAKIFDVGKVNRSLSFTIYTKFFRVCFLLLL